MKTVVLFAVVAALAALAAPSAAFAAARSVTISGSSFQPSRALALVDDTVVWTNRDFAAHNVTFSDGERSRDLPQGEKFERTFTSVGTFPYHCTLHAGMRGTVSVAQIHLAGPAAPVRYGATATFTGLAPAGAAVEIKRGDLKMAAATAGSDGRFDVGMPAKLPGRYYAAADGKTSATVAVKVRPRVALATRRSGRAVYVTAGTNPAQVGAPVVLQRRTSSGWTRVASARLDSRSKATFRVVPRAAMKLRVQLTRGVQGYSPSTSATITVRP